MNRFGAYVLLALAAQPVALVLAASPVIVTQVGRAFSLHEVRIRRGDTLRFTNGDEFFHHIYVDSPSFKFESAEQAPGTSIDVQFPTAGRFDVRCQIHPKMLLTVSVE